MSKVAILTTWLYLIGASEGARGGFGQSSLVSPVYAARLTEMLLRARSKARIS